MSAIQKGKDLAKSELFSHFAPHKAALWGVAGFSAVINILMLVGPLFMLQVYDRVLASHSSATLLVLFAIVVFLYGLMGVLDHVRGRVLARVGAAFQSGLEARVFSALLRQAEHPQMRERPATGLRDLQAVQSTLGSNGMGALFDLPWAPVYIALLYFFHHTLGIFALISCVIVTLLAVANQRGTRKPLAQAVQLAAEAEARTEATRKAIETVRGLGMVGNLSRICAEARDRALGAAMDASDRGGAISATTKALRLLLQSAILAFGAYLALRGDLTAGAMIASSILLGRALAPVEQAVGHWPQFQRALQAWGDLDKLLTAVPEEKRKTDLPRPEARVSIKDLVVVPAGENAPVLGGVNLQAVAGDAVAVIGPSASGKSSFARALVGLWPPARGEIRLAGADLHQYEKDRLGREIGYLPQEVVLFAGTVAQNIARFDPDATSEDIVRAAQEAAAHDLILSLPNGYDTVLTDGGGRLSGGQKQRIGLARAFYGNPVMLVLDEPNAALDDTGVQALNRAIKTAREAGKVVFIMSHRPSALAECNLVMMVEGGQMRGFGPRDEILAKFTRPAGPKVVQGPTPVPPQQGAGA